MALVDMRADDRTLQFAYAQDRDPRVREELVRRYLPLAKRLARRYQRTSEPLEDLEQSAMLGLLKAIDRFDPDSGNAFSTYAVPTITGELRRHFRDKTWAVHVPRGMQEAAQKVKNTTGRLADQLGRMPTVAELAGELGMSIEDVVEGQVALTAYRSTSYDQPVSDKDGDEDATLLDLIGGEDPAYEQADARVLFESGRKLLDDREFQILRWRYYEDLTQAEIAQRLDISQMHVSRLQRRGEARLREAATA